MVLCERVNLFVKWTVAVKWEDDLDNQGPGRKSVSVEEALQAEMLINQALIDLLISKGIITQEELMTQVQAIRPRQ